MVTYIILPGGLVSLVVYKFQAYECAEGNVLVLECLVLCRVEPIIVI